MPDGIEFCECFDKEFNTIAEQIYSGETISLKSISTDAESLKDFCDGCKKPVTVVTQNMRKDIQAIYG